LGISDHQQSWGFEEGPWKGWKPPLLVVADFKENFFDLFFNRSIGVEGYSTDSSMVIICSLQSDLAIVVRLANTI
jgi:hypothetical protein